MKKKLVQARILAKAGSVIYLLSDTNLLNNESFCNFYTILCSHFRNPKTATNAAMKTIDAAKNANSIL
ncbi:MAG: hypothetical protein LBD29_02220 [Treponema sp.]|nr:hypothetical protein [Treponema sp.]